MDAKTHQNAQEQAERLIAGDEQAKQRFAGLKEKIGRADTVADIFQAWREEVIPPTAQALQVAETERAMYAASSALILAFFRAIDRSNGDGQAAMDWLNARLEETQEFAAGKANQILMNRR